MRLLGRHALALAAGLVVAGCATEPKDPIAREQFRANHDPFEPLNRETFAFNQALDRALIKPAAKGYVALVPAPARDGIRRFLNNLGEPVVFGNEILQGRARDAGVTVARFAVNSTVGIAGFRDVAARNRLQRRTADFGQTLWAWGIPDGPYIILPVLGPTNPRDLTGAGIDTYIDPFRYVARANNFGTYVSAGRAVLDGIDKRARSIDALDEMQKEAIDFYASFRSLFRQHRAAELAGVDHPVQPPAPNFYDDPER
jgi:phospholipid-binding lipoprotein MlaA